MKIVADRDIPFLRGVLEPYAELVYLPGGAFASADVQDADALIIRTRTRCGASLLNGSRVSMIATATIGTDHIDLPWCATRGIEVASAAGCNSGGVMQYVFTALYALNVNLMGKTLGVIGVGHVGSKVAEMGRRLGFRLLCCDPPRARAEGPEGFVELDELLSEADIVTLHVPLQDDTRAMAGTEFFSKMKEGAVFINCSRGEVVDEDALIDAAPKLGPIIIDTWPNEPVINRELLALSSVATPHIAGYSLQGKLNGTTAVVRAVAEHFGIDEMRDFTPKEVAWKSPIPIAFEGMSQSQIAERLQDIYPIMEDDRALRRQPENFELLRSGYSYRMEFC